MDDDDVSLSIGGRSHLAVNEELCCFDPPTKRVKWGDFFIWGKLKTGVSDSTEKGALSI
jgi:hypothetical protein